jgi:hypothetical protein
MLQSSVLQPHENASEPAPLTEAELEQLARAATYLADSWPAELVARQQAELLRSQVWQDDVLEWPECRTLLADQAIQQRVAERWARIGVLLQAIKQLMAGNAIAEKLVVRLDDAVVDFYLSTVESALEVVPEVNQVFPWKTTGEGLEERLRAG